MNNYQKIEWVHWFLTEIEEAGKAQGVMGDFPIVDIGEFSEEIKRALAFVEDIREVIPVEFSLFKFAIGDEEVFWRSDEPITIEKAKQEIKSDQGEEPSFIEGLK